MIEIHWNEFSEEVSTLLRRLPPHITQIYGVPTGGSLVARELFHAAHDQGRGVEMMGKPGDASCCAIIDDLEDSGATLRPFKTAGFYVDALFRKKTAAASLVPRATQLKNEWIQFPWEHDGAPTDAVVRILQYLGEDPSRDGLVESPPRVLAALKEMCSGYAEEPREILKKAFTVSYDEMIVEDGIEFYSLCEHHLLPFFGTCVVGYLPQHQVVGASKMARLVQCYARRLQIQERMTMQIAKSIEAHTRCLGVGVVISAQHLCMGGRGVRQARSTFKTSCLLGAFRDKPEVRQEFLALANAALSKA